MVRWNPHVRELYSYVFVFEAHVGFMRKYLSYVIVY